MSPTLDKLKEMMYELTDIGVLLGKYLDEVRRLQKQDKNIIVSELDDTIFSRDDMLQKETLLAECSSEEKRNKLSMYHIGIPKILEKYYIWKTFPQDIVSLMNPEKDFILTSGFEWFQHQKAKALWLEGFPMRVAAHKEEKVLNCIQYILYELKYIPKKLIIYDNDTEDFIRYHELIKSILDCNVSIIQVKMDNNKGYKEVKDNSI